MGRSLLEDGAALSYPHLPIARTRRLIRSVASAAAWWKSCTQPRRAVYKPVIIVPRHPRYLLQHRDKRFARLVGWDANSCARLAWGDLAPRTGCIELLLIYDCLRILPRAIVRSV